MPSDLIDFFGTCTKAEIRSKICTRILCGPDSYESLLAYMNSVLNMFTLHLLGQSAIKVFELIGERPYINL